MTNFVYQHIGDDGSKRESPHLGIRSDWKSVQEHHVGSKGNVENTSLIQAHAVVETQQSVAIIKLEMVQYFGLRPVNDLDNNILTKFAESLWQLFVGCLGQSLELSQAVLTGALRWLVMTAFVAPKGHSLAIGGAEGGRQDLDPTCLVAPEIELK